MNPYLWCLKVNGRVHTFGRLLDLIGVIAVLRMTLPEARLTVKRMRFPA